MLPLLTIAYTNTQGNAVEVPLNNADQSPKLRLNRNAVSYFTYAIPGADPALSIDIPFEGKVAIYQDRAGQPNAYNGGTRIFYGRRIKYRARGTGRARAGQVTIADAFYDLANTTFQHYWNTLPNGQPAPGNQYFARINLFQNIQAGPNAPWTYFTADQQITQIVQLAALAGTPLQIGRTDPVWNMPLYPVRAISCLEALQICVRSIPDAVLSIDYSTNDNQGNPLPTFNVTQRPNCAPVTLPYSYTDPTGRTHTVMDVAERQDLLPSQVVFQYQQTNVFGGVAWTAVYNDVYPPNSTGLALRAVVVPIDLRGALTTFASGAVTSIVFNPALVAFWKIKKNDLSRATVQNLKLTNAAINDGSVNCITILDTNGNPVNLNTYKYEWVDGAVAPFMLDANNQPIKVIECVVSATLSYDTFDPRTSTQANPAGVTKLGSADTHPVNTRIKLTNSIPNPASIAGQVPLPTTYSTVASSQQPEQVPFQLAQNIYTSLNVLQYELEYEHVEDHVSQILTPANVLNLTGPGANPNWANMNAMIENVEVDFFNGRQHITCGPFKHLSAKEFFDLLMMWRIRLVYENPAIRSSGKDTSSTGVQIGQNTTKQDTNASDAPPMTFHAVLGAPDPDGNQTAIYGDAANNQWYFGTLDNTGAKQTPENFPSIFIDKTLLVPVNGVYPQLVLQQTNGVWYIASGQLSGGGASAKVFTFKTMFANYFIATDGTRIAKDGKLRNTNTSELTPDGIAYTMTYQGASAGNLAYIARTKRGGNLPSSGEFQRVSPPYTGIDEILAIQAATVVVTEAADTGIAVGTPVGWIELKPSRQWTKKVDQSTP